MLKKAEYSSVIKYARELVASSSFARFLILALFTILILCAKTVNASNIDNLYMTESQAQAMITFYQNQTINFRYPNNTGNYGSQIPTWLENLTATDFCNAYNNWVAQTPNPNNYPTSIDLNNGCVIMTNQNTIYPRTLTFKFIVPDVKTDNLLQLQYYNANYPDRLRTYGSNSFSGATFNLNAEFNADGTFKRFWNGDTWYLDHVSYTTTYEDLFANQTWDKIVDNKVNIPALYCFNSDIKVYYNNSWQETNQPPASYIDENTTSENGAYFFGGNVANINVNTMSNLQLSGDWFYIGNNINFDNTYYYYDSNNNPHEVKNLISLPYYTNETGKIYMPNYQWFYGTDYYPNDIYQDIIVTFESGDIFESKYLVQNQKVITWYNEQGSDWWYKGTITNPSGEVIANISGETNNEMPNFSEVTITSGDITNALGFKPITNKYQNFWWELTTGLGNAFIGSNRRIEFEILEKTYVIDLDVIGIKYPTTLETFIRLISSSLVIWLIVKWAKIIVDKITMGDIDSILYEYQEEGIVDIL